MTTDSGGSKIIPAEREAREPRMGLRRLRLTFGRSLATLLIALDGSDEAR